MKLDHHFGPGLSKTRGPIPEVNSGRGEAVLLLRLSGVREQTCFTAAIGDVPNSLPDEIDRGLGMKMNDDFDFRSLGEHVERRDRFDQKFVLQLFQVSRKSRRIA